MDLNTFAFILETTGLTLAIIEFKFKDKSLNFEKALNHYCLKFKSKYKNAVFTSKDTSGKMGELLGTIISLLGTLSLPVAAFGVYFSKDEIHLPINNIAIVILICTGLFLFIEPKLLIQFSYWKRVFRGVLYLLFHFFIAMILIWLRPFAEFYWTSTFIFAFLTFLIHLTYKFVSNSLTEKYDDLPEGLALYMLIIVNFFIYTAKICNEPKKPIGSLGIVIALIGIAIDGTQIDWGFLTGLTHKS